MTTVDYSAAATCAATVGCNRLPTDGLICRTHLERLAAVLREIEDQAAILSAIPSMQAKTGRSGSLASQRSPAILDAIVASDPRRGELRWGSEDFDPWGLDDTASVLHTLHQWARQVRTERQLADPQQVTVTGERDLLTRHLTWIAEQPWVDELLSDLTALLAQLKRTNHTEDPKPAGRCHLLTGDDECGGPIWIDMDAGHAHCGQCRATWDGPEVVRLTLILEQQAREAARPHTEDGEPMLTAHELAEKNNTTVNAIRITASRRRIANVDGHYDPRLFTQRVSELTTGNVVR